MTFPTLRFHRQSRRIQKRSAAVLFSPLAAIYSLTALTALSALPAEAMPDAPMLKLSESCPTCAQAPSADRRAVIVHEAFGELRPNLMPDWAEVLSITLKHFEAAGAFEEKLSETKARVENWARNPMSASSLPRAKETLVRRESFRPEVREALKKLGLLDEAEALEKHRAGMGLAQEDLERGSGERGFGRFSALHRRFLLIDGNDPEQREWVKREAEKSLEALSGNANAEAKLDAAQSQALEPIRVVLAQGDLEKATELLPELRLWFDQGGSLRRRLGVTALPAKADLSPEGLVVEEVGEHALSARRAAPRDAAQPSQP